MRLLKLYTDLSIGLKLALGFTLLIVLALLIGLSGLQALNSYGQRSEVVATTAGIESSLLDALSQEKSYLLNRDEAHIEQARTQTRQVLDGVAFLDERLVVDSDRTLLEGIRSQAQVYLELLDTLVAQVKARSEAIAALESAGWDLQSRISIEEDLFAASALLRQIRRDERNFLINHQNDARLSMENTAQRALSVIESSALDDFMKDPILVLFQDYMAAFATTVDRVVEAEATETRLDELAATSVTAAKELRTIQLAKMSTDRSQAIMLIVITTAVVLVLGILLAWSLTRSIAGPVRQAAQVASQVAGGDLRTRIESDRKDEFGQLLNALGRMVVNLRELVGGIDAGANDIAASAAELSTVSDQASDGASQQRDQTDQVATAMNEMVATVTEVARSAESAFNAAGVASDKTRSGERAVEETLSYVSRLTSEVENAREQIARLQSETQNIGSVLDVIKSVADQTNLLALNAAIEAARAGEHGRGFAVVADEVRSLAKRTQSSATEIESLISSLVTNAESSVQTMAAGGTLAGQTLDSARTTGETIRALAQAVEEIREFNSQIATAAEQQTSVAEDINQNVTRIRDISDQSASSSQQVVSAATQLTGLGKDLRNKVALFQV